jgi:hypothetical protein
VISEVMPRYEMARFWGNLLLNQTDLFRKSKLHELSRNL